MEASSPHNKPGGADRLSNLPEELIHAVMSFLPSWQAVQTSLLSRKWRDLWITRPCLDLDQQQFDGRRRLPRSRSDTRTTEFIDFVTNLMLLNRAPALDRFRLVVTAPVPFDGVDGWIRYAVTRCPAALRIHYGPRLWRHALPAVDYSRYCGRLRRLRLYNVELDARFAAKLESGCPVLVDLELESCGAFSNITLPPVTNLTIRACENYLMVVTAPALWYLSCHGNTRAERKAGLPCGSIDFTARIRTCGL